MDVSMVAPSMGSTVVFLALVFSLVLWFLRGTRLAAAPDEPEALTRRWGIGAAVGVVLWLAGSGSLMLSGVLAVESTLSRMLFFFIGSNLLALGVALSPVGRRFTRLPTHTLIGFQVFRLPLEFVLAVWAAAGVINQEMTFMGYNFDIVTGITAAIVAIWVKGGAAPKSLPLLWNFLGLGLLFTVVSLALMSGPLPTRVFFDGPALVLAFHFPYGYIVPVCVAGALFGHVVLFRKLLSERAEASASS